MSVYQRRQLLPVISKTGFLLDPICSCLSQLVIFIHACCNQKQVVFFCCFFFVNWDPSQDCRLFFLIVQFGHFFQYKNCKDSLFQLLMQQKENQEWISFNYQAKKINRKYFPFSIDQYKQCICIWSTGNFHL